MMEREEFQKRLEGLGELAKVKDNCLHADEIRDYMKDLGLTEEQYQLVFAYLDSRRILVEGYQAAGEEKQAELGPEEEQFLRRYREELSSVERLSEDELQDLAERTARNHDAADAARLVEQLLPEVPDIALALIGGALPLGDLVQEGNVGLMLAVDMLQAEERVEAAASAPLDYLRGEIREAMNQALEEQQVQKHSGDLIAGRLNDLQDGIKKLSEELERDASLEEISVFLDMPVDEIETLIKLAGETGEDEETGAK